MVNAGWEQSKDRRIYVEMDDRRVQNPGYWGLQFTGVEVSNG